MNSQFKINETQVQDFHNAFSKLEEVMRKSSSEEIKMIDNIKMLLRRNINYSAEDIADSLGIARSTLFYRLKKLGISLEEIKKAVLFEIYQEQAKKIKKREKKALPPVTYDEFLEREVVKEIVKAMLSSNISESYRNDVLQFWYRLCFELKIAPEDFIEARENRELLEEIRKKIIDFISIKAQNGREKNALIAKLQALQKWLEVNILPSYIEQAEYKGKYQSAEIPLEARELLVRKLIEYGSNIAKLALRSIIFLYYTGSRAESLTNFTVEGEIRIEWLEFVKAYGESEFIIVKTEEKGKKGKKFTWRKLIPKSWAKYIPNRNLTSKELQKVRDIIEKALREIEYPFNEDTKKYIYEKSKTLHIWRHTFARDALRAFKWNRYLVAKLGGWVKDSNLQIYGDFDLLSLIQEASKEHQIKFVNEETKKLIDSFLSS